MAVIKVDLIGNWINRFVKTPLSIIASEALTQGLISSALNNKSSEYLISIETSQVTFRNIILKSTINLPLLYTTSELTITSSEITHVHSLVTKESQHSLTINDCKLY